jgi:solute:Na+ symporter, SSS family
MTPLDVIIVCAYIVAMLAFGMAIGIRETAEDYLILSRRAGFLLVIASVVSTWVGVGMFVGTTASGYETGISLGFTGAVGALTAVITAALFAPRIKAFGDRYQAHTLGDFFRVRYSLAAARAAAVVVVLVYLTFTAVQFAGLSALLRVWGGFSFEAAILVTGISTIIYTAFAGIKSDFYTDAIHFVVMTAVLFGVLLPRSAQLTDNFSDLRRLPSEYFDVFAFGGIGYFAGGVVLGIGLVFVSMEIWQRIYASTSAQTARWALVGSAVIILPFYLLAALLGMTARALNENLPDRDLVLFTLMQDHLTTGVLGLGIAAFIALFVSSANTMIMVVAATITKDFARRDIKPMGEDGPRVLRNARLSTLIVGTIGLSISFLVRDILTLSVVALFLLLVLLPGVIGGFFWKRATSQAALWSIVGGILANAIALPFGPETAFVPGFLVSVILFVGVSLLSKHSETETHLAVG